MLVCCMGRCFEDAGRGADAPTRTVLLTPFQLVANHATGTSARAQLPAPVYYCTVWGYSTFIVSEAHLIEIAQPILLHETMRRTASCDFCTNRHGNVGWRGNSMVRDASRPRYVEIRACIGCRNVKGMGADVSII